MKPDAGDLLAAVGAVCLIVGAWLAWGLGGVLVIFGLTCIVGGVYHAWSKANV